MTDPNLFLNAGLLVATAGATAIAWWQAIAASRAENGAVVARRQAQDALAAAERQAVAAEAAIEQGDRHRSEDRRSQAIIELAQMMIDDADTAIRAIDRAVDRVKHGGQRSAAITALDRFRNNARFVRAQAMLEGDDVAVANWVLTRSELLYTSARDALKEHGLPMDVVGPARAVAMSVATETITKVFAWQRGQVSTQWFVDQSMKNATD